MNLIQIAANIDKEKSLQFARKIISKDVIFTLINSLWKIVSGPITLVLIPLFLTAEIQGFWYAFISIAALSILADLGFTTIVAQFSAHEYAHLNYNFQTRRLEGDSEKISKIGSLFRFVIKWALSVSIIGFPLILLAGIVMFWNKGGNIDWIFPWILYVISSGLSFTTNVILSFLEGCNQISEIQKNKIISAICLSVSMWIFLYFGFGLYSLAITALIGTSLNLILLFIRFKNLIYQLYVTGKDLYYNWIKDFLRLIWRYAISWSSGYFIFQIYTPLTFHFHGPIDAGKVGISMALATAIFTISNVWIYVSTPKLNMYASRKEWHQMDKLIIKSIVLSVVTFIVGMTIVIISLVFYTNEFTFMKRFLGPVPMSILLSAWIIQLIINALAVYLRAHKQEPLVGLSIALSTFIITSTFLISKYLSSEYLFLGFLVAVIWGLPVTLIIFKRKKLEWHN
jgi:O-antigen/teichoic acid export membrane protein